MATTLEFGNDQCLQCLIREHVFIRVSLFQLFDQCFKTENRCIKKKTKKKKEKK
jgi:hypothetical protein